MDPPDPRNQYCPSEAHPAYHQNWSSIDPVREYGPSWETDSHRTEPRSRRSKWTWSDQACSSWARYGSNLDQEWTQRTKKIIGHSRQPINPEKLSKIHNLYGTLIPINKILILQHTGIFSNHLGNQFYSWLTNEKEGFIVLRMQLKISLGYNFRAIRNYNFISYQWIWNEPVIFFSEKFIEVSRLEQYPSPDFCRRYFGMSVTYTCYTKRHSHQIKPSELKHCKACHRHHSSPTSI